MPVPRQSAVRKAEVQPSPRRAVRPVRRQRKNPSQNVKLNASLRSACILLVLITAFMAGFVVIRGGTATSEAYQLNQLKNQAQALELENARLHLDVAYLKSPERIQDIAVNQLGMILPDKFFFSTKK